MSCRSTACGRAASSAVTALTAMPSDDVPRVLHALKHDYRDGDPVPATSDILHALRRRLLTDPDITAQRRAAVLQRIDAAEKASETSSPAERYAWAHLVDEGHKYGVSLPPQVVSNVPAAAHQWWTRLSATERAAAYRWHARQIGALDGVPFNARDTANRAALAADEERLRGGRITDERYAATMVATRKALNVPGRPRTLLLYQPEIGGDGRVAIGCGDFAAAEHITIVVPGYRGRVPRRLHSLVSDTDHVLDAADRWTHRMHGRRAVTAGVAWIGYRSPSVHELPSLQPAAAGARNLRRFAAGAAESGHTPVTVIGHSYGGVVAALAARDSDHITRIVLAGAPGAPLVADRRTADVFVVSAQGDHVPGLRWFTGNTDDDGPVHSVDMSGPDANHGHLHYFDADTAAVRHMGAVVAGGNPPTVQRFPTPSGRNPMRTLLSLARRFAPDVDGAIGTATP